MGKHERVDIWYSVVLALIAGLRRLPAWLSETHLTFDEGVFLASTDLARSGLSQYQDFFSSQGPLFIPMLQVSRFLSLGDPRGPRTLMVASGIVATVATYFILTSFTTRTRAFWFTVPVAVSGTVFLAAGPLHSDGVALALGLSAIAFVIDTDQARSAVIGGLLLGLAVAVKSLHTLPFIIVVAVILIRRQKIKELFAAGLSGITVLLVSIFVADAGLVLDQYVVFHLAKDNSVNVLTNLMNVGRYLVAEDLPVVILLGAVGAGYLILPRPHRGYQPSTIPVVWLMATAVVFLGFTSIDGGFIRNIAFFIPPMMALAALADRLPFRVLAAIALLAIPFQFLTGMGLPEPSDIERSAVEAMRDVPENRLIVSDDPGLIWAAGRLSHPDTVDPSFARFNTGYLDARAVEAALADPQTCLYVATSGRFESGGVDPPGDYLQSGDAGIFRRSRC